MREGGRRRGAGCRSCRRGRESGTSVTRGERGEDTSKYPVRERLWRAWSARPGAASPRTASKHLVASPCECFVSRERGRSDPPALQARHGPPSREPKRARKPRAKESTEKQGGESATHRSVDTSTSSPSTSPSLRPTQRTGRGTLLGSSPALGSSNRASCAVAPCAKCGSSRARAGSAECGWAAEAEGKECEEESGARR